MMELTSTQLHIIHRVDRALVIRVKDVGLVATAGAPGFHGWIEASRPVEV